MKLLYFAWLRTKTGVAEEQITPPDSVTPTTRSPYSRR